MVQEAQMVQEMQHRMQEPQSDRLRESPLQGHFEILTKHADWIEACRFRGRELSSRY